MEDVVNGSKVLQEAKLDYEGRFWKRLVYQNSGVYFFNFS